MFKLTRETTPTVEALADRHHWPVRVTAVEVAVVAGSIDGTEMTVTAVASGTLAVGQVLTGDGITVGTVIDSQTSGTTGGVGVYQVSEDHTPTLPSVVIYGCADVPAKIFVMQEAPPGEVDNDFFSCVASVQQMEDLPEDAPTSSGPYYRVGQVTLLTRSAESAEEFALKVTYAAQDLADNLRSADVLAVESVTIITPYV